MALLPMDHGEAPHCGRTQLVDQSNSHCEGQEAEEEDRGSGVPIHMSSTTRRHVTRPYLRRDHLSLRICRQ